MVCVFLCACACVRVCACVRACVWVKTSHEGPQFSTDLAKMLSKKVESASTVCTGLEKYVHFCLLHYKLMSAIKMTMYYS